MKAEDKAREIISAFAISGECINIKVNKQGHINSTFISEFDDNEAQVYPSDDKQRCVP